MSEQRYTWYPETDKSPCYIDWYPVGLQLAPAWFRADVAKGSATYDWGRDDIPPTKVYRDDLRGGWHVVPSGVRFVAVQGIKAGQRCAPFGSLESALGGAELLNEGRDPGFSWEPEAGDVACVLDLHDLKDRDTKPSNVTITIYGEPFGGRSPTDVASAIGVALGGSPREAARKARQGAPRFIVRAAAEMREGEPYIDAGDYPYEQWNSDDIDHATNDPEIWHYNQREDAAWVTFLVDTHSPTWQAFDREHRTAKNVSTLKEGWKTCGPVVWSPEPVLPEVAKPSGHRWNHDPITDRYHCTCGNESKPPPQCFRQAACSIAWDLYAERAMPTAKPGPTDAEVCAAWESVLHWWETNDPRKPDSKPCPLAYQWDEPGYPCTVFVTKSAADHRNPVTFAQYQAARSRELAKRQREAREQERRQVTCQGDWPGEGEFDA